MSVIVVSTCPRTTVSPVHRPFSATGEQAPSLRPERAGRSLSLVETVRVDSPAGGRRGRAEVGQAASLPAAPAGAKSAAKAIPTAGRLAACPTLACARRRFRTWTACLLGLVAGAGLAWAQGTAFSYQGQLTDGAAAANGTYDLTFSLWNSATAGTQQGATLTQAGVGVTNGLFTATLDFGAQFTGAGRWLEIAVRTNGAADFATLAERQPVLPTPYAIHATTAGSAATATTATTVTGNVPASQLTGTLSAAQIPNLDASKITSGSFTGNGSGLTGLNASALTTGTVPGARIPDLDAGKITAGTLAAARIPNLDASKVSTGTFTAAQIPNLDAAKITSGVLSPDRIPTLDASKIVGGTFAGNGAGLNGIPLNALVQRNYSVAAWGDNIDGQSTVPAGLSGVMALAAGGSHSLALKADGTVIAWGNNGDGRTTVPAGLSGVVALAAGGFHSLALKADGTVVAWGDNGSGQTTVPAGLSGVVTIAAGLFNSAALKADGVSLATLARLDRINVFGGAVFAPEFSGNGAGLTSLNASALTTGTVPAARIPDLDAGKITTGTLAAARIPSLDVAKVTTGTFATARIPTLTPGQIPNLDASKITTGTVTDGRLSANIPRLDGSPVMASDLDLDAHKLLLMPVVSEVLRYRAGGAYGVAGPVLSGTAGGVLATGDGISGLERAVLLWREDGSVNVPGGITAGTVSGNGAGLTSLNASALNTGTVADARLSANVALKNGSPAFTAAAGSRVASFTGSRTGGHGSAVAHVENTETGTSASPALRVLGRGTANDGALSVSADAGRIARFGNLTDWVAVLDNDGKFSATSFVTLSDRNKKAGFAPVDVEAVLAKVASLPLTTWHYTNDAAATPHLGPMAQDFHAAFGLGGDDKTITTVDADGVALAAIQGLHRRTETLAAENAAIREELARQQTANADLRDELGDLRSLVRQLQQQLNANRP